VGTPEENDAYALGWNQGYEDGKLAERELKFTTQDAELRKAAADLVLLYERYLPNHPISLKLKHLLLGTYRPPAGFQDYGEQAT